MRRFSKVFASISLFLTGSTLLFVFQNCGTMGAEYNPLYDNDGTIPCIGLSCERDLSTVGINTTVTGVVLEPKTTSSNATTCDGSTCFDVGGFCETGGYPKSVFIYQWVLEGQLPEPEVRTTSTCDENGRFRVLVKVPFAKFDWVKTHRLRVFMKVIDEKNVEAINPTGESEWSYVVTVRI